MKKKMRKILGLVLAVMTVIMSLGACGNGTAQTEKITVTLMNGTTQLGQVTGEKGGTLTDYAQYEALEGYEFLGWYETPTFLESSKKDLATATFDADTTLYGSFKSKNVTEDTRKWYIVGAGSSSVLAASNWAGTVEDAVKDACQLKATGNATNEFSITVDLFAGDQFQVIYDWQWNGQKGYGCFTTIDATQMENGGGLAGSADKSNVNVIMDGNYTITLTTDPDNALQDTLVIVRNGDAVGGKEEGSKEPEYVVSETTGIVVKGSWVSDWSENKELTRVEGTNTFKITMELAAGIELYFMVYDNGTDTGLGMNATAVTDDASKALLEEAYNIKVKDAGTYTFTVDADTMTITVSK